LVLLDLSAAFDTVDHPTLIKRLEKHFGITQEALTWIKSYLSDRTQSVKINSSSSSDQKLTCNVPQGSVLGPTFFSDYSSPLAELIRSFGVKVHLYADDSQLFLAFKPGIDEDVAISKLEECILHVRSWMAQNFLKLNDDKTEFLIIGSRHQLAKVKTKSIRVGLSEIQSSDCARNIGAWFDSTFKLEHHVNTTCRAAWNQLRTIGKVRRYLTEKHTTSLVHAFVTTKLDHNNSMLYGCSKALKVKLQKVQNAASKLVTKKQKFDHVTPILRELHWLPVEQRIIFKIALLVYKCLQGIGPSYLTELLEKYEPGRDVRSAQGNTLRVPRLKLTYGVRSFSHAGPIVWNSLPLSIRKCETVSSFKKHLKTHLFTLAFEE